MCPPSWPGMVAKFIQRIKNDSDNLWGGKSAPQKRSIDFKCQHFGNQLKFFVKQKKKLLNLI